MQKCTETQHLCSDRIIFFYLLERQRPSCCYTLGIFGGCTSPFEQLGGVSLVQVEIAGETTTRLLNIGSRLIQGKRKTAHLHYKCASDSAVGFRNGVQRI